MRFKSRGHVKLQRLSNLHEMVSTCTLCKKVYAYVYIYARKSRPVVRTCICLAILPKVDEKYKILLVREFRISRCHARTYQMFLQSKDGFGSKLNIGSEIDHGDIIFVRSKQWQLENRLN